MSIRQDDLAALGIRLDDESSLRTGVEAQVEVDADPQTIADTRKMQEATRAVARLEEAFDAACEQLADAEGAVADATDAEGRKTAIASRAELQKRRAAMERQLADAAKAVQRMATAHKQNRADRLRRVLDAQRIKNEDDRRRRQEEEERRLAATRAGVADLDDEAGAEARVHQRHAPGRLLNGAVSAGSRTLLSARRAQRVLNTRIDRSHIDPRDLAPQRGGGGGGGTNNGRADEAATTEAVRDYRGGSTVLDSALRVTVSGVRRRDRTGASVDDGDLQRFNARQQEEVERKQRIAHRKESRRASQAAADNTAVPRAGGGGGGGLIDEEEDDDDNDDDDQDYVARMATRAMREADLGAEISDEGMSASGGGTDDDDGSDSDDVADVQVMGTISVPAKVWVNLLDYQQVGVRWLLERHLRRVGGILGDEMGLGKTVQVAAMLSALFHSDVLRRPVLILAPLTVLKQWVAELRKWAPALRTVVLHSSGSSNSTRQQLLAEVAGTPCVVMSTYQTAAIEIERIVVANPQYVILDEGHKICNPDASVTIAVKTIPTPHRLILSGSPIQNTLKELWCLFDFVAPGTLGTVATFVNEFEEPIKASRNPSATTMEVQLAIECAKALRDHIAPFLLRRLKREVNTMLPPKHEKVVRCLLSDAQLQEYLNVLGSSEVRDFQRRAANLRQGVGAMDRNGRMYSTGGLQSHVGIVSRGLTDGLARQAFKALSDLRSITNHADLFRVKADHRSEGGETGYVSFRSNNPVYLEASGKLKALALLLAQWKEGGHRVLVFSQTRTALDIIENLVEQSSYTYFRMDGTTPPHHRQPLIDRFNNDPGVFVALLTTRVGGLGVNLVGADRVVIFDPDWNPVTDEQARERAWRIGQTREVCIYRFVTSGTVEEHILHRQLAKLFVAEKVLSDPTLQRSFHLASMAEAFMLGPEYASRVDPNSRALVSLDSFSVADEVRRGQDALDAHGNTIDPSKMEKKEEEDDETKPIDASTRRMILTDGGVVVSGPSANRGTTSRLAALEGSGERAVHASHHSHSQSQAPPPSQAPRALLLSVGGSVTRPAAAVVVKSEADDSEDAKVMRQASQLQRASTGGAAASVPPLIIEDLAQEGGDAAAESQSQAQQTQQSQADPDAQTGILQNLMSGSLADAADPNSLAGRLARIAAHRTLHRATSATLEAASMPRRGHSSATIGGNPVRPAAAGQQGSQTTRAAQRQPLLPSQLLPAGASATTTTAPPTTATPARGRGRGRGG